jgi:predicted ATPase
MIHRLTIENFRSFNKEVEMDFTAKPEKTGRAGYVQTQTGEVVSRVNMFIGPNASGKSNLLKALAVIYWALVESAEQNVQKFQYLFQFIGNNGPIRISVETSDGTAELFRYEVALLPDATFVEEQLSLRATTRAQWKTVFHRHLGKNGTFTFAETAGDWATITQRTNASLVGSRILSGTKPGTASAEHTLATRIQSLVKNSFGNVAPEFDEPQGLWWHGIGQKLAQDETLRRQAAAFMKNADVGISSLGLQKFKVNDPKTGVREIIHPVLKHEISGRETPLPFHLESIGTRILLALFAESYPVVAKSGIISLDEIERGIHPHLLPELVNALTPPGTASQVFLVSHSDYLLRCLEHDQVFLTEKRGDGGTDIYRADSVEDFKTDRNLLNWYHAGKLGAIPHL